MKLLGLLVVSGTVAFFAQGAPATDFPNVRDESFTEPNGSRALKLSIPTSMRRRALSGSC